MRHYSVFKIFEKQLENFSKQSGHLIEFLRHGLKEESAAACAYHTVEKESLLNFCVLIH